MNLFDDWIIAAEPLPLTDSLRRQSRRTLVDGKPLGLTRKLQLASVAGCQRLLTLFPNPLWGQILTIVEAGADQLAFDDDREVAKSLLWEFRRLISAGSSLNAMETTAYQIVDAIAEAFGYALGRKSSSVDDLYQSMRYSVRAIRIARTIDRLQIRPSEIKYLAAPLRDFLNHFQASGWQAVRDPLEEERYQCDLIRDVFQHPEHPTLLEPTWLTANVIALAQTIYDQKHFHLMPILADALQDAVCENETILQHCQHPVHVRGCWLLDLLLGKT